MSAHKPYGSWPSPLTASRVTAGALRLDHVQLDGEDVYWVEGRASEGGRYVIVRRTADGAIIDVTPTVFNVRTRVHEYGGAAYTVDRGTIYFANFADQRIYRQRPGAVPEPITAEGGFYADFRVDRTRDRLISVREDHSKAGEAINTIVAIGGGETVLVSGADFYSDPIVSPDGASLAWLQWHHPNMPWDGTELCVARFETDGTLGPARTIAGGATESIFQPEWSPDGTLYFVSDRSGWWNLHRLLNGEVEVVHAMAVEFGKPQWTFSMVTYAFMSAERIAATYTQGGRWQLALIDTRSRTCTPVPLPVQPLESIHATADAIYFIGGSATEANAITRLALADRSTEVLRSASAERIEPAWISVPLPARDPAAGWLVLMEGSPVCFRSHFLRQYPSFRENRYFAFAYDLIRAWYAAATGVRCRRVDGSDLSRVPRRLAGHCAERRDHDRHRRAHRTLDDVRALFLPWRDHPYPLVRVSVPGNANIRTLSASIRTH